MGDKKWPIQFAEILNVAQLCELVCVVLVCMILFRFNLRAINSEKLSDSHSHENFLPFIFLPTFLPQLNYKSKALFIARESYVFNRLCVPRSGIVNDASDVGELPDKLWKVA